MCISIWEEYLARDEQKKSSASCKIAGKLKWLYNPSLNVPLLNFMNIRPEVFNVFHTNRLTDVLRKKKGTRTC
jgi:hypothetical protein